MDLQRALITKLIDSDGLNHIKRSGIDITFLDDDECKQVFSYIERHYREYKKVPSRSAIHQVFPNFSFVDYPEPLEFFVSQIKEVYRRGILEEGLLEVNRIYNEDTKQAEEVIRETLKRIAVTQKSFKDLNLVESATERVDQYDQRKVTGVNGVLSSWSKIDYQTLGFHPEEFVVIVGEKYIGKSWLMLWMAYKAMLQGERVLFATKEMSAEDLADRFDAIYAGVQYDSLRRAELSSAEEERFRSALGSLGEQPGRGSITMARHSVATVADIEQKSVEVDATIIFIDSVYLFDAGGTSREAGGSETQRRMAISQRCKRAAQELGISIIVSTQAGRRKTQKPEPSLDNIEWSNAFSQDADVVMEVIRDDIDKELNQAWIHLLKVRKGQETMTCVKMDFNFMKFEEITGASKEPSYDIVDEEEKTMWTPQPTKS